MASHPPKRSHRDAHKTKRSPKTGKQPASTKSDRPNLSEPPLRVSNTQDSELTTYRNFRKFDGALVSKEDVASFQSTEKTILSARMAALRENLNKLVDSIESRMKVQIDEGIASLVQGVNARVTVLKENSNYNASSVWISLIPREIWTAVWHLGFTMCQLTLKDLTNFSLTCTVLYKSDMVQSNWWDHVEKDLLTDDSNPGKCVSTTKKKHNLTYVVSSPRNGTLKGTLKNSLCKKDLYFCFRCKRVIFCPQCRQDAYENSSNSFCDPFLFVKTKRHKADCVELKKYDPTPRDDSRDRERKKRLKNAFLQDPWVVCKNPKCDVLHRCGFPIYKVQKKNPFEAAEKPPEGAVEKPSKEVTKKARKRNFSGAVENEEPPLESRAKRRRTTTGSLVAIWPPTRKITSNKIQFDTQEVDQLTSLTCFFGPQKGSDGVPRFGTHALEILKDLQTTYKISCEGFSDVSFSMCWFKEISTKPK